MRGRGLTGSGTEASPYEISNADELEEFCRIVESGTTSANAELTADIDLSGKSWTSIGSSSYPYTDTFNGNGHTIKGFSDNEGIFGYVGQGGLVQNLTVTGTVSSYGTVGGIVTENRGGTIENCTFNGSVSVISDGSSVGGVVGDNDGTVKNCYNTGSVTATNGKVNNYVGGVVGHNDGSVTDCYNAASVSVTNSSGNTRVGGVVGYNDEGHVTNCYNTGEVSGPDSGDSITVGGVVGYSNNSASVTGCYFLRTNELNNGLNGIGGDSSNTNAAPVTNLTDQTQFQGWDFTDIWRISKTLNRPVLQDNAQDGLPPGLGTADSPYEISTATQLKNFATAVNSGSEQSAHAKLMNNIDLKDVCGPELDDGTSWTPIGNTESPNGNTYKGTFDGQGHSVKNLYVTNSGNAGLFGYVYNGGIVKNLSVSGSVSSSVSGTSFAGGVAAINNEGTIENCSVSSSVSVSVNGNDSSPIVGGVVGQNSGSVKNCSNTGNVTAKSGADNDIVVGGVVGFNSSGSVTNCTNTGSVSGTASGTDSIAYVGGVVGQNSGSVTNCYFLRTDTVNVGLSGIGKNVGSGDASNVEARTADEFHSGEVAWLLENGQAEDQTTPVWGQSNLNTPDSWPTLIALDNSAQPVYKVTVDYGNYDGAPETETSYTNTVTDPSAPEERDGYTFDSWETTGEGTTTITYTAKWIENAPDPEPDPDPEPTPDPEPEPTPEPEEPPYSGKYSYEISTDIGDNGTLTVDRYATEGDTVTIAITPDQAYKLDDLSVTANGKDVELTANGDGTYSFTMPSADVRITATFAEDPDWTEPEEPATDVSTIFLDVAPNAWYKDAVQYAYDNGLMTGTSANEFAPEQTTTRAMIVSILARLENVTSAEAAGFADVQGEWYATAVNWAANVGIVNGYEDNTFRPNTAITREQLAAILMNYASYKGEDVSNRADLANYTDQPSAWAEETMSWAVAEGLISGVTNTELQPQGNATRAQVAAILQRFLEA